MVTIEMAWMALAFVGGVVTHKYVMNAVAGVVNWVRR